MDGPPWRKFFGFIIGLVLVREKNEDEDPFFVDKSIKLGDLPKVFGKGLAFLLDA